MERKITALKIQKRNAKRINVYLDGEFAFGLSRITGAWLEVGQVLNEEQIRDLQAADEEEVAYQKALHFLSYRPRSENEVRSNLRKNNLSDAVIPAVIERLRRNQLLNDYDFAETWVANRSEFRPRGRRVLQMELRQKGISDEVIDAVVNDLDEDDLAYRAATKQSRKYRGLAWEEYRQKMIAYLARRGFNYHVSAPIVQKVWSETGGKSDTENLNL